MQLYNFSFTSLFTSNIQPTRNVGYTSILSKHLENANNIQNRKRNNGSNVHHHIFQQDLLALLGLTIFMFISELFFATSPSFYQWKGMSPALINILEG